MDDDQVRESVQAVRHAVIDGTVADGVPDEHVAQLATATSGGDRRRWPVRSCPPRWRRGRRLRLRAPAGSGDPRGPRARGASHGRDGGANSSESGRAAAHALLDGDARPTAILAISDALALGVLEVLRNRQLEPGRDVSVTGFDDVSAAAVAGLTTVRQPIREKGA